MNFSLHFGLFMTNRIYTFKEKHRKNNHKVKFMKNIKSLNTC